MENISRMWTLMHTILVLDISLPPLPPPPPQHTHTLLLTSLIHLLRIRAMHCSSLSLFSSLFLIR